MAEDGRSDLYAPAATDTGYRDCERCGALLQPVSSHRYECQQCGHVNTPGGAIYSGDANEISFT